MAELGALKDVKIYLAENDFSGRHNRADLQYGADMLDNTKFGATGRSRKAGIINVQLSAAGFLQISATDIEQHIWNHIQTEDEVLSVCPVGTEGEIGYSFKAVSSEYSFGGSIGDLLGFTLVSYGRDTRLVRGTIGALKTGITGSGNGTAYELGAVGASQSIYGILHVHSYTASTLDVIIQSDSASNFPSATSRITFTQASAKTSEWATTAGAIADTWWRVNYTVGGGTWGFTVLMGIFPT